MKNEIPWDSFVAALNYKSVFKPSHSLRRWISFRQTSNGLEFLCQLENGDEVEGYPQSVFLTVDVIFADVLRVRIAPDQFRQRSSDMLIKQDWDAPDFQIEAQEDRLVLTTQLLKVEFIREPWQICAYGRDHQGNEPFFSQRVDDRAYGPGFEVTPPGFERDAEQRLTVHEAVAVKPGESIYGLGEKFTPLDKWGQEHRFWAVDSGNVSSYRSYKNIPFLMSSAGYGVFVHSSYPMVFRMGSQSSISYSFHIMDSELDYFLIYGPSYKGILKRYSDLTGRAPVPPKWSFGFWISRAGYKQRTEVEDVVREMRAHSFPCDVISLDPWWMGKEPWTTLEWDLDNFPDPAKMMKSLRQQGVRTCLWIHPYLPVGSPIYQEAYDQGYLVRSLEGSPAPVLEAFSGSALAAVDFTNPGAHSWFQSKLNKLLEMGAAVFKTDFGEQAPIDALYFDGRRGLEMHNLYPLLYNRCVFELTEQTFGRGLTWGRSGYAGSQRYPVQWGGDSYSSLDQLACQVRGLLSYGMSGVPFCSHDIGGFDYSPRGFDLPVQEDFPKDAVAYLRWLQVGVFSSHTRAHGKQPREPWTYGKEVERIARSYLKLRYRLLPYIYSQAVVSSLTALPMVRPLALEFQQDPTVQRLDLEYMFGDTFLVAPVLTPQTCLQVYLPEGRWVDFWSKEVVVGGRWVDVDAPLGKLPLWVREGSILPLGPEMDYVNQKTLDPLTLELYLPVSEKTCVIYDEDLPSIPVSYTCTAQTLEMVYGAAAGNVEVIVYGLPLVSAQCNGRELLLEVCQGGQKVVFDGRQPGRVTFNIREAVFGVETD